MSNKKSLLVMGDIPAGKGCPFMDKCDIWKENENCPTWEKPNKVDYSCAFARALDLLEE